MKSVFELLKSCCEALEECLNFDFIESGLVTLNAAIEMSRYPLRVLSEEHVTTEAIQMALDEIDRIGKSSFDRTLKTTERVAKELGMINLVSGKVYDESKSDYVQATELIERLGKMCVTLDEQLRDYLKKSMDFICGTTSFITKDEFMSSAHEVFNKSWLKGHNEMVSLIRTV